MLLDTHVVLWLLNDDSRLGTDARALLTQQDEVLVSTVSVWEIAIKTQLGKLTVPEDLPTHLDRAGLTTLDLTRPHVWESRRLDGLPHRDPFDRMLLAQALAEGCSFLTADAALLTAPLDPTPTLVSARS